MTTKHLVKRAGHTEPYESRKVYASIYSACLALRVTEVEAEDIANHVSQAVDEWIVDKTEVTSHQVFRQAIKYLHYYHPGAAYLYEHHSDLC